jgi:hypothetical protein
MSCKPVDQYTSEYLDDLVEKFYAGHSNPINHEPIPLIGHPAGPREYTTIQALRLQSIKNTIRKLDNRSIEHSHGHFVDVDLDLPGGSTSSTPERIAKLGGRVP